MRRQSTKIALVYTSAEDVNVLSSRVKICVDFARSQGWAVRDEIVELGTGHLAEATITEIIKEADSRSFQILVIDSLVRLGLDEHGLLHFIDELRKHRRHFACINERIFTWTEAGRLNLTHSIALGLHKPQPVHPTQRVSIYCFSQTDDKVSIERQRKGCKTHAQMKGWPVTEAFTDFDTALASNADALMVYSLDRLSAETPVEFYALLNRIEASGKTLATVKEAINTQTPEGRTLFGMNTLREKEEESSSKPAQRTSSSTTRRVGAPPKAIDLPILLADWLSAKLGYGELTVQEIAKKHLISKGTVFSKVRLAIGSIQDALEEGESLDSISKRWSLPSKSIQFAIDWLESQNSRKVIRNDPQS